MRLTTAPSRSRCRGRRSRGNGVSTSARRPASGHSSSSGAAPPTCSQRTGRRRSRRWRVHASRRSATRPGRRCATRNATSSISRSWDTSCRWSPIRSARSRRCAASRAGSARAARRASRRPRVVRVQPARHAQGRRARWTVERQTRILRDNLPEARGDWRMRTGVRGRWCAILATA